MIEINGAVFSYVFVLLVANEFDSVIAKLLTKFLNTMSLSIIIGSMQL